MLSSLAAGLSRAAGAVGAHASIPAHSGSTSVVGAGADFGAILADVAGSATRSLQAAEGASSAAMFGKTTARDVVEKAMKAEQDLQVALALRDKTISALQEISRMAI